MPAGQTGKVKVEVGGQVASVPLCHSEPQGFVRIFLQNVRHCQDGWILNVYSQIGQKCKSEFLLFNTHTALRNTTAAEIVTVQAQQMGHYTD